jgi:hypothetical protein
MKTLESLLNTQRSLLKPVNKVFVRSLYDKINWDQRLICIKGPRGSGKTTMLLQHLKFALGATTSPEISLYASADHPYFYSKSLFDLAEIWVQHGGKYLIIDEIHKLDNWSSEIKVIYDSFPDLSVIFSSSSALNVYKGEGDLSRRLSLYDLPGLSFREYLNYAQDEIFEPIDLKSLFANHEEIARYIIERIKPIPLFKNYLRHGYFPFSKGLDEMEYMKRLQAVINTVLDVDLVHTESYSRSNTLKIRKLLGLIADMVPFEPNTVKLAAKMGIGRVTLHQYLGGLSEAKIINYLIREHRGISTLTKPDKIYLENTNLSYALTENPNVGSLRETFTIGQFFNSKINAKLPKSGDLIIDDTYTLEIGGKSKSIKQIRNIEDAFILKDSIEVGFQRSIPLWLIGFLY